jgi:site-specific DNA recombinase
MKKVISYTRVSTKGQTINSTGQLKEDHSAAVQADRCFTYYDQVVDRSKNYEKVVIEDLAFSGSNTNRPGYNQMIKLIKSGKVKAVLATELSRISRNTVDFFKFIELCKTYNVQVIILGLNLDSKTAVGKMFMTMMIGFAQMEREQTIERQKKNNYARLIKDGKINGGTEILGLKSHPNKKGVFVEDKESLKILRRILNIYCDSSTRGKAVKQIKIEGLKNINGKPITLSVLDNAVKNCAWRYVGKWYANLENKDKDPASLQDFEQYTEVDLPHGQIVPQELIERVLEKQKILSSKVRQTGSQGYVYLLSSVLIDEKMNEFKGEVARGKGGQYRYYRNLKTNQRLKVEEVDSLVMTTLRSYLANDEVFHSALEFALSNADNRKADLKLELSSIEERLRKLESKEEKLRKSLVDDDAEVTDWFKKEIKKMVKDKRQLELQSEAIKSHITKLDFDEGFIKKREKLKKELSNLKHLNPSQLRDFVECMIDKVVVLKSNEIEIRFRGPEVSFETVTRTKKCSESKENGGSEGTRTLGLLRDRQTL